MLGRLLIAVALAAAGSGAQPAASSTRGSAEPGGKPAKHRTAARITLRRSRFGKVLFDGRGRVLYLFDRERSAHSACYGACAEAWPPFTVAGRPAAGKGVDARLIGTTRRRGGARQATYAGHPLYRYVGDGEGQILCHDVVEFGGRWLVVQRSGKRAP